MSRRVAGARPLRGRAAWRRSPYPRRWTNSCSIAWPRIRLRDHRAQTRSPSGWPPSTSLGRGRQPQRRNGGRRTPDGARRVKPRCLRGSSRQRQRKGLRPTVVSDLGIAPPGLEPKAGPDWGSDANQDSPDPESAGLGRLFRQLVGNRPLPEHRCPLPRRSLPASARRNCGKTTACQRRAPAGAR
jgi:hypothetical protein